MAEGTDYYTADALDLDLGESTKEFTLQSKQETKKPKNFIYNSEDGTCKRIGKTVMFVILFPLILTFLILKTSYEGFKLFYQSGLLKEYFVRVWTGLCWTFTGVYSGLILPLIVSNVLVIVWAFAVPVNLAITNLIGIYYTFRTVAKLVYLFMAFNGQGVIWSATTIFNASKFVFEEIIARVVVFNVLGVFWTVRTFIVYFVFSNILGVVFTAKAVVLIIQNSLKMSYKYFFKKFFSSNLKALYWTLRTIVIHIVLNLVLANIYGVFLTLRTLVLYFLKPNFVVLGLALRTIVLYFCFKFMDGNFKGALYTVKTLFIYNGDGMYYTLAGLCIVWLGPLWKGIVYSCKSGLKLGDESNRILLVLTLWVLFLIYQSILVSLKKSKKY